MNPRSPRVSPLRQRMIEDMRMRKLEPKTRAAYLRAVKRLAIFLGRSPDTASVEDLRRFQLYLVDQGTSPITLNATLTGLKFFFDVTLGRAELMARMQPVRVPHTLPVVLSRDEVARLIAAAPNLKSQTALSIAYGTGLRVSEVISLKVTDIAEQGRDLQLAIRQSGRGAAHHCRRCQAPGRTHRRHAGAAHLGLGPNAPSPRPRHRARRWTGTRRQDLGGLPPGVLLAGARALKAVQAALPRRAAGTA